MMKQIFFFFILLALFIIIKFDGAAIARELIKVSLDRA